jgi:hypothetical protein
MGRNYIVKELAVIVRYFYKADADANDRVFIVNAGKIRPQYLAGNLQRVVIRRHDRHVYDFIDGERIIAADGYAVNRDIYGFSLY